MPHGLVMWAKRPDLLGHLGSLRMWDDKATWPLPRKAHPRGATSSKFILCRYVDAYLCISQGISAYISAFVHTHHASALICDICESAM